MGCAASVNKTTPAPEKTADAPTEQNTTPEPAAKAPEAETAKAPEAETAKASEVAEEPKEEAKDEPTVEEPAKAEQAIQKEEEVIDQDQDLGEDEISDSECNDLYAVGKGMNRETDKNHPAHPEYNAEEQEGKKKECRNARGEKLKADYDGCEKNAAAVKIQSMARGKKEKKEYQKAKYHVYAMKQLEQQWKEQIMSGVQGNGHDALTTFLSEKSKAEETVTVEKGLFHDFNEDRAERIRFGLGEKDGMGETGGNLIKDRNGNAICRLMGADKGAIAIMCPKGELIAILRHHKISAALHYYSILTPRPTVPDQEPTETDFLYHNFTMKLYLFGKVYRSLSKSQKGEPKEPVSEVQAPDKCLFFLKSWGNNPNADFITAMETELGVDDDGRILLKGDKVIKSDEESKHQLQWFVNVGKPWNLRGTKTDYPPKKFYDFQIHETSVKGFVSGDNSPRTDFCVAAKPTYGAVDNSTIGMSVSKGEDLVLCVALGIMAHDSFPGRKDCLKNKGGKGNNKVEMGRECELVNENGEVVLVH